MDGSLERNSSLEFRTRTRSAKLDLYNGMIDRPEHLVLREAAKATTKMQEPAAC